MALTHSNYTGWLSSAESGDSEFGFIWFEAALNYNFRLPVPRPGQVLGLVGTNGIGKSTALKVLAGKLKPNLGRFNVMFSSILVLILCYAFVYLTLL